MAPPLIELSGITKSYGPVKSLQGVDLRLAKGEVLGVVGDNGAGKSTLMKILAGAVQHDGGEMRVNGEPVRFSTPLDAQQKRSGSSTRIWLCATRWTSPATCSSAENREKAPSSTGMPCTRRRLTFSPTCMSR